MKTLDKIAYDVAEISSLTVRAKDGAFHEYKLEAAVIKKLMEKAYKMGIEKGKNLVVSHFSKMNNYDNNREEELNR
jgi:hypothetical protein